MAVREDEKRVLNQYSCAMPLVEEGVSSVKFGGRSDFTWNGVPLAGSFLEFDRHVWESMGKPESLTVAISPSASDGF